jgi:hypothetical protein
MKTPEQWADEYEVGTNVAHMIQRDALEHAVKVLDESHDYYMESAASWLAGKLGLDYKP